MLGKEPVDWKLLFETVRQLHAELGQGFAIW